MANTAERIIEEVGGKQNIESLTHCATRLRFTLKDAKIIDDKKVDSIPGVMGVVPQSDTAYQVIIGGGVADIYEEIQELLNKKQGGNSSSAGKDKKEMTDAEVKAQQRAKIKGKNQLADKFFEFLSDSFRPIIGVLLGASLIIAGLNLMISFGVINDASDTTSTLFLNAIAQSVFYFLPILIAYNACKKLKVDPWVGAVCMLTLFTPQFLALLTPDMYASVFSADGPGLQAAKSSLFTWENPLLGKDGTAYYTIVFGVPLLLNNYKANVFVPLLMSACLAGLYKFLKKIIPSNVQLVFVPFLSMIIMVPVTAFILGPIGLAAGSLLGSGLSMLNSYAPFIFAIVIPLLYPFLVPLGLHWPLNALMLLNIDQLGFDFIQGPMGVWNFACFGCTFGVLVHAIRERDTEMSGVAGGALAAGFLGGVSEPSLYGIHLRYKKVYQRLLAGCAAGGITIAVLGFLFPSSAAAGVTTKAFAFTSLLTIPVFDQVWVYAISIAVAFTISAVLVIMFDYRTPQQKAQMRALKAAEKLGIVDLDTIFSVSEEEQKKMLNKSKDQKRAAKETIIAPVKGTITSLKNSADKAFAIKALGEGVAIEPDGKTKVKVMAPVAGEITSVSGSKHAYTIMSKNSTGVLVHIGVDTVKLNGSGFIAKVSDGDEVKAGDTLCEVDLAVLEKTGHKTSVFVTVVNTNEMNSVTPVDEGIKVKEKDKIIEING